jgi:hypothetical protein
LLEDFYVPILPLGDLGELAYTMLGALEGILSARALRLEDGDKNKLREQARDALRYCAVGKPLSDHTIKVLTDISASLKDLASMVQTEDGRAVIKTYLEDDEANRFFRFWTAGLLPVDEI